MIFSKRTLKLSTGMIRLMLLLLLVLMIFLTACTTTNFSTAPEYPIAGHTVAVELEEVCFKKVDGKKINLCPNLFYWLDRIKKHRDKIAVSNK